MRARPVIASDEVVAAIESHGTRVIQRDLVDGMRPTWHDPRKLQAAFVEVLRTVSFTSDVKDRALARVEPVCSHCDRAQLAAIIRIEGTLFFSGKNRYRVEVATDTPSVARLVIRLVHEIYGLKTELDRSAGAFCIKRRIT